MIRHEAIYNLIYTGDTEDGEWVTADIAGSMTVDVEDGFDLDELSMRQSAVNHFAAEARVVPETVDVITFNWSLLIGDEIPAA